MSGVVPDQLLWRRVAALERQVAALESQLRRVSTQRMVTPLGARLWRATLNEAFGDTSVNYAAADLLTISGSDTGLDVSLFDPLGVFVDLTGSEGLYCFEQIDVNGTRYYVPMQSPCP